MADWTVKLVGDENKDTYPWATVSPSGVVVERYNLRSSADARADRERIKEQEGETSGV